MSESTSNAAEPPRDGPFVRVLIVDDDADIRSLVRGVLERHPRINVVGEATNAQDAYELVSEHRPDVVVMDVRMPRVDGIEATRHVKELSPSTEVVGLTASDDRSTVLALVTAGASGYVVKGSPMEELVQGVLAASRGDSVLSEPVARTLLDELTHLYRQERHRREEVEVSLRSVAGALATAIEARDVETGAHSFRVTKLAMALLAEVDPASAKEPMTEYGFLLHDVGKIAVPDAVLRKPGPLTPEEWNTMRGHPLWGAQILRAAPVLADAIPIVRHHHERWDGTGYPDGLTRQHIPAPCRAFAVADAFDAMTSDRPYRLAMPTDQAVEEIWKQRAVQFDPDVVEAFLDAVNRKF